MEFGQIQLNYLDWTFQGAKEKMELLTKHRIPVWVMEPMRGGQLATLSSKHANKLKALRPQESIPAWSHRFLSSIPEVVVSLTGASNLEQLKENIAVYQEEKPLTQVEMDTLLSIAQKMIQCNTVHCTSCAYCLSHCPQQLDIPRLLNLYNEHSYTVANGGLGFIAPMALSALPNEKQPKACTACGKCESVCPQQVSIADAMQSFVKMVSQE
jgi:predicted aldo/keto reductase-like oxidoreductase